MNAAPILITAFNRPQTLLTLLRRIEGLSKRNIVLSIDGPKLDTNQRQFETMKIAAAWQKVSHHKVSIIGRKENLGVYNHLPVALADFFSDFSFGIIIEDDIEFTPDFINFVDQNSQLIDDNGYWSICGHNPQNTSNPYQSKSNKIIFRTSHFHAIWGWATSKAVALNFVNEYWRSLDFSEVRDVLDKASREITLDPFLRKAILVTWMRKLRGWEERRLKSGWDTRWIYQAWKEGRLSLIPDCSLSRESLDQSEGQTHKHGSSGELWINEYETQLEFSLEKKLRGAEVEHLRTWGIGRRYSWLYYNRIKNELDGFLK